jgi:transcriptional regulator with XRE-family HTH domain
MAHVRTDSAFGRLLRQWRERRRLSQLDFAGTADVSSRHVSFLEKGRAQPSREMVLLLARVLDLPLRDRNHLLTAAGFAAIYRETDLDAPAMAQIRRALDFILRQQVVNWEAMAASLIQWLHRDVTSGFAADETRRLLAELLSYPGVPRHWRALDLDVSTAPFLSVEFRRGDLELRDFSTLTSLGTPHDITLQELRIESFFPADELTEAAARRLAAD